MPPASKRRQPNERVSYQREVAGVCEREICDLGCVEPPEVVVLCRRSINGVSGPPLDEPDPHDDSGFNDSDKFGPRLLEASVSMIVRPGSACTASGSSSPSSLCHSTTVRRAAGFRAFA